MRASVAMRAQRHLHGPFDLVYERFALFQQLGRSFQRRGVPWVVETNAVISQEARLERNALALQRLAARLERRTYHQADLIVCISDMLRELLVSETGVPADKVAVIPNAVDIDRFSADGPPAGAVGADGEVVVGFVGFVIARQGIDELVHAIAALRGEGRPIRALVVGDGPDRPCLQVRARELGVADAVEFPGQVAWGEVPARIASFSVGYSGQRGVAGMPMYHSPLKIYEYLAMGRPVVATAHPDAERALVEAGAGWTFPAGDEAALSDVLRSVTDLDSAELTVHGERARRHVVGHHTWAHRSRQLTDELARRGLLR
jgi:glycosyltransferase involved in cell wall biosynthesis